MSNQRRMEAVLQKLEELTAWLEVFAIIVVHLELRTEQRRGDNDVSSWNRRCLLYAPTIAVQGRVTSSHVRHAILRFKGTQGQLSPLDIPKETTLERADFTLQLLMFVTVEKERRMFIFFFLSSFCQLLSPRF